MLKHHKTRKNRIKSRRQKGGERVSIYDILMTPQVEKAIKSVNPEFKLSGFKADPNPSLGSNLPRWSSYKNRIANITSDQPITVRKYKTTKYYQIHDGRHRFAQAILSGSDTVNVRLEPA